MTGSRRMKMKEIVEGKVERKIGKEEEEAEKEKKKKKKVFEAHDMRCDLQEE
jgi:hypothetical protein